MITDVVAVLELFPGFVSGVLPATEAVLRIVAPSAVAALTLATIVIEAEAPEASDATETMRLLPEPPQVPSPVEEQEIKRTSGGRLSVTITEVASMGPLLVTLMLYVTSVPAITGSGESLLVMARSVAPLKTNTPLPVAA